MKYCNLILKLVLLLLLCPSLGLSQDSAFGTPQMQKKNTNIQLKGFPQENLAIPVRDATTANIKIDNKLVAIDGYWEFKDEAGKVLAEPIILSQPTEVNDRLIVALRTTGRSKVEVTEDGETKVYEIVVAARFTENSIEKEVEAAILEFVGDPGLRVRMMPPQSALVGANLTRSFGSETASEILAPRGQTAGSATGTSLSADDFRSTIILSGEVENELVSDKALNVAYAYSNNIVNLMSIRTYLQMKIKVKVVSVERSEDSNIGIQYSSINNPNTLNTASPQGFGMSFASSAPFFEVVNGVPIFGNPLNPFGGDIRANVNLGKANSTSKVLQEPTLTVINGQAAVFNVGSQIPIQTRTIDPNTNTTVISVVFRQIGVTLRILPTTRYDTAIMRPLGSDGLVPIVSPAVPVSKILGGTDRSETIRTIDENGIMRMTIQPDITTLGAEVGGVPSFNTNFVETKVAMKSGQSLIIGGLFDDQTRKSMESIPFIEKIPILGELFKNRVNGKVKRELIFVLEPTVLGLTADANRSDFGDKTPLENEINERKLGMPETEKVLEDIGSRKPASKPVRISAGNVTPREVTIMEKAPSDFPPVQLNKLSTTPQSPVPSGTLSVRPDNSEQALEVEPTDLKKDETEALVDPAPAPTPTPTP